MKQLLMAGIEKWFVTIVTTLLVLFGTAAWDYFKNYYDMPSRMDRWEHRADADSIFYTKIINAQQDQINFLHLQNYRDSSFLAQDYIILKENDLIK